MIFLGFFLGILAALLLGSIGAGAAYLWLAKGVSPVDAPKFIAGFAKPKEKKKPKVHDDFTLWQKENET